MKPGDKILVKTKTESIEGVYVEKPALLGSDTIIVKLENGYNIGVDKSKILDMKVVEEYNPPKAKSHSIKSNPNLPKVTILSTGGTISSKVDYTTGGVISAYTASDFVAMCPELEGIANIEAKKILDIMSEDAEMTHWREIAKQVSSALKDSDGVVVTVGTDTLGYITSALSFALSTKKPVIVTAAQRSIDRPSSDAFFNLLCSVNVAAQFKKGVVGVCMHASSSDDFCYLLEGVKVRKMHTSRRDAFRPVNTLPLAKVFPSKIEVMEKAHDNNNKKELFDFSNEVALVYIHPGITSDALLFYKSYKGVILMGTGFGHVPLKLHSALKELVDLGVFVGMTSQCLYGSTSGTVYSPLRKLSMQSGVVFLEDMLPETAFVKLSWVVANFPSKIKEVMLENISGEFRSRRVPKEFLF